MDSRSTSHLGRCGCAALRNSSSSSLDLVRRGNEPVNHSAVFEMDGSEDHRVHLDQHLAISEMRSQNAFGKNFFLLESP